MSPSPVFTIRRATEWARSTTRSKRTRAPGYSPSISLACSTRNGIIIAGMYFPIGRCETSIVRAGRSTATTMPSTANDLAASSTGSRYSTWVDYNPWARA